VPESSLHPHGPISWNAVATNERKQVFNSEGQGLSITIAYLADDLLNMIFSDADQSSHYTLALLCKRFYYAALLSYLCQARHTVSRRSALISSHHTDVDFTAGYLASFVHRLRRLDCSVYLDTQETCGALSSRCQAFNSFGSLLFRTRASEQGTDARPGEARGNKPCDTLFVSYVGI
jgi:hypothetical protein